MQTITVGSRDSKLAIVQAQSVVDALQQKGYQTTLMTRKTTGDLILDRTLAQIGGKGLFVKELDAALREGQADFTVHSLKDMPMDTPQDLPIVAVSRRADVRDVLVLPEGVTCMQEDKPIGCASARRRLQLQRLYPNMRVEPIRGNIQTRLRKLDEGQFGALVLAAAGLHRLGLEQRIHQYFTTAEILPAVGQAVIAVQARAGTDIACLAAYHDAQVWQCVVAERAFARALSGGCTSPVAAFAQLIEGQLHLEGMYVSQDERTIRFGVQVGMPSDANQIGTQLAQTLQEQGETT